MLEHRPESRQATQSVSKDLTFVTSSCSCRISRVSRATHSSRLLWDEQNTVLSCPRDAWHILAPLVPNSWSRFSERVHEDYCTCWSRGSTCRVEGRLPTGALSPLHQSISARAPFAVPQHRFPYRHLDIVCIQHLVSFLVSE
jgi:hypothetical protein